MQWGGLSEASNDRPGGGITLMPAPIEMATVFISSWYSKTEGSSEGSTEDQLRV